tara:strand:+ start:29917 stop:30093 length:177 start_codon:yes stop_codon:yes gene_type:complete
MIEQANKLIEFGTPIEQAEGHGMLRVILALKEILNTEGDDLTDGEVIDQIYSDIYILK